MRTGSLAILWCMFVGWLIGNVVVVGLWLLYHFVAAHWVWTAAVQPVARFSPYL